MTAKLDWQVELFRLTVFPAEPRDLSGEGGWWLTFTESEPEVRATSKKVLGFQEEGNFSGGRLTLVAQLDRIDWRLTPIVSIEGEGSAEFDVLGSYPEVLQVFLAGARRWLATAPDPMRVAIGAVLLQPTESRPAGYRTLQPYLPMVKVDPDNMRDFMFQVNYRRFSRVVDGLELNRIMKWSAVQKRLFSISPAGASALQGAAAVRVELDINSSPESTKPLPRDTVVPLFDELDLLGKEIAEKGAIA
jgi:hypothetical protein